MYNENKEIIIYAFRSFGFLIEDYLTLTIKDFSKLIKKHYNNERINYICNVLDNTEGQVTNKKIEYYV
jgi:hypothetical protein